MEERVRRGCSYKIGLRWMSLDPVAKYSKNRQQKRRRGELGGVWVDRQSGLS